jgi:hypothetical protein
MFLRKERLAVASTVTKPSNHTKVRCTWLTTYLKSRWLNNLHHDRSSCIREFQSTMYKFHSTSAGPQIQFSNDFRTAERHKAKTDVSSCNHVLLFVCVVLKITFLIFSLRSMQEVWCSAMLSWKPIQYFKFEWTRKWVWVFLVLKLGYHLCTGVWRNYPCLPVCAMDYRNRNWSNFSRPKLLNQR